MKKHIFSITLLLSIFAGGFVGYYHPAFTLYLKPIGDIFLNMMLVSVVPLVFFSVASAIEKIVSSKQLGSFFLLVSISFLFTSIVAAVYMCVIVSWFPPAHNIYLNLPIAKLSPVNISEKIVSIFSVKSFMQLFSHENLLPLIFFSMMFGTVVARVDKDKKISQYLLIGGQVFSEIIAMIMMFAPLGFFAYFAVLISQMGPQLVSAYLQVVSIYYAAGLIYFLLIFTIYLYLGGQHSGVIKFWKNISLPALTAFATCSSAASIPANIEACKKMGIPATIYESLIPLGAFLHKDGSVLGGVIKIAFLFGFFHMTFAGTTVFVSVVLVSLLVGVVMGAIPSGGMLGEMLIISLYDFPPESLLVIVAISILIDPMATMLNVTGDCVCGLLVANMSRRVKS